MSRIRKQLVSSVAYIALLTIFFHLSGFLIIVFLVSVLFYPVKSNFPLGYVRGSISEIICNVLYLKCFSPCIAYPEYEELRRRFKIT